MNVVLIILIQSNVVTMIKRKQRTLLFYFKKLESLKITHGDLKSSNILVDNNSTASLIDLDSMKQHKNNVSLIKAQAKDKKRLF